MTESTQFVGRTAELDELNGFIRSVDAVLFVLVGKPGMGKSALVRELNARLQGDHEIFLSHLFDANRDLATEELASEMAQTLSKGQFFLWEPDDSRKLATIAAAVPLVGPLLKALIADENKSQRRKLVEILNLLSEKTEKRIVLIIDPFDYIEKIEYEEFFTTLVRNLTPRVKIIVPQRPADVLAVSSRFLALPTVRSNKVDLGPLTKEDSYRMALSLSTAFAKDPDLFTTIWELSNGWPLALYMGLPAIAQKNEIASLSSLESLFSHLLGTCPPKIQDILYALSLPSLDFYLDDLRAVVGLKPEEFASVITHPTLRQMTVQQTRSQKTSIRLFHVLIRDYIRNYMKRMEIPTKYYLERLHSKLLDDAKAIYRDMDNKSVIDRDATALVFAEKLRLYEAILEPNDYTSELATILLNRIDSLRYGGRSYSLYSLLVLARRDALLIKGDETERFLKVFCTVLLEDSFLHPEYALLLIGSMLTTPKTEVKPEARTIAKNRITHVAKRAANAFQGEIASSVHFAVEQGINPLLAFELDQLLPSTYRQNDTNDVPLKWSSPDIQSRTTRLINTPIMKWTIEDHSFMYRYIRYSRIGIA